MYASKRVRTGSCRAPWHWNLFNWSRPSYIRAHYITRQFKSEIFLKCTCAYTPCINGLLHGPFTLKFNFSTDLVYPVSGLVEWALLGWGGKLLVIAFRKYHVQIDAFIIITVWGPVEWVEDKLNGLGCPGVIWQDQNGQKITFRFLQPFHLATPNGWFLLDTFSFCKFQILTAWHGLQLPPHESTNFRCSWQAILGFKASGSMLGCKSSPPPRFKPTQKSPQN